MTWSSKEFFDKYKLPSVEREIAIVKEVLSGNTPSWMFDLCDVKIGDDVVEVMPDYLAIGTDQDYVRCPMTPYAAQAIADYYKMTLPKPELVDAIWKQAGLIVNPIVEAWNWKDNPPTGELGYRFVEHSKTIDAQLNASLAGIMHRGLVPGVGRLIAGQKKDIVGIPSHLAVSIYGWHELDGHPIQPLYRKHGYYYADYAHGVRLVKDPTGKWSGPCCLDQPPQEFAQAFKD